MFESGYYPPGAEFDPNAPYNQPSDPDPVDVKVCVSETLHKTLTLNAYPNVTYEEDETGKYPYCEFDKSELFDAFDEQSWSIEELLPECAKYLNLLVDRPILTDQENKVVKNLIKACEGWSQDEFEIIEE